MHGHIKQLVYKVILYIGTKKTFVTGDPFAQTNRFLCNAILTCTESKKSTNTWGIIYFS